ncbi:MAG: hypothetical protein K9J17_12765 [Flavobacteriales bacterium]|nr:hypothetical protein [Flavobacteriales bacterium]
MKTWKKLVLISSIALISSCKKEEDCLQLTGDDYLIFGHFFGECGGESCVETYKLTDAQLFEDQTDDYNAVLPFVFVELDNSTFLEVNDLMDYFPAELLAISDSTFGCPDCADQGGLLVEYYHEGQLHKWRLDRAQSPETAFLQSFADKVVEKIAIIND